jgi:membrane-associated PAP2 superfamily phosphatase
MKMTIQTPGRQILLSTVMLVIALLWFELTATDIWLQDFLFNAQDNTWLLDAPGQVLSFIFYDGIKKLLILFALGILICLLVFRNRATCYPEH